MLQISVMFFNILICCRIWKLLEFNISVQPFCPASSTEPGPSTSSGWSSAWGRRMVAGLVWAGELHRDTCNCCWIWHDEWHSTTYLNDLRMDLRVAALQKWSNISPASPESTLTDIVLTRLTGRGLLSSLLLPSSSALSLLRALRRTSDMTS